MEKFFESESLTEDEMREGIRKGLAAVVCSLFSVYVQVKIWVSVV